MTRSDGDPIVPGSNRSLGRRELLRGAALAVAGLALVLLVRNAMKPPEDRSTTGLAILAVFIVANAVPLLMSLKLRSRTTLLRVAAAAGIVVDLLVIAFMSLYVMVTAEEGFTALRVRAVLSSIGGSVVCGLVLVLCMQAAGDS